eukprot:2862120-Pleurochrysis_carterae.AAC.2
MGTWARSRRRLSLRESACAHARAADCAFLDHNSGDTQQSASRLAACAVRFQCMQEGLREYDMHAV